VTSSRPTFDPWFDIAIGLLALVGALVLRRRDVIPERAR
jgi:MYXO-CTERM domain-containing protein